MFADLKEKAAAVDRKRIYTAAAALLIAGAAGHFMQRSAGGSGQEMPVMAASIIAPGAGAVAHAPETEEPVVTVARLAEPPTDKSVIAMPELTVAADAGTAPETLPIDLVASTEPAPEMKLDVKVASVETTPETMPTDLVAAAEPATPVQSDFMFPEVMFPEVTRSASEPLLSVGAPATTPSESANVVASASEPFEMPAPAAVTDEPATSACAIDLQAEAAAGALIAVSVTAPCNSGEDVAFEHAGLKFNEQLGPDGSLYIEVPAMVREGAVTLKTEAGNEMSAEVTVPDFDDYDRIALVWKGAMGLQLHAFEGGAGYEDVGHIWADAPANVDMATNGKGGFVSVLGSTADGYAADVYTYPNALMQTGPEPEVSVEAEVMENTCESKIEGWILRTNAGHAPTAEPLSMSGPGCDAVGEYLVLKNLPADLKLARK